jgi:hypothetical protein
MLKEKLAGVPALAAALAVLCLFTGCASTYKYGPEDTPPEQMATLKILGSELRVVAADEYGVKWKGGSLFSGAGNTVNLPAGTYTFTVNYQKGSFLLWWFAQGDVETVDAMHIGEKLLPGHTYQLKNIGIGRKVELQLTDVTDTVGGAK